MLNFIAIMLWSIFIFAILAWGLRPSFRNSLIISIPVGLFFCGVYYAVS